MSFGAVPPSQAAELAVTSQRPAPAAHDHGEEQVTLAHGTARWTEPGARVAAGHGRGELAISAAALTFELRGGQRTFARAGGEVTVVTRKRGSDRLNGPG